MKNEKRKVGLDDLRLHLLTDYYNKFTGDEEKIIARTNVSKIGSKVQQHIIDGLFGGLFFF